MFNNVKLGIAPIGWTNDDMPQLGGELTFEQMVSEAALAGFQGTEVGGKFPTDPAVLNKALDLRGIKIASQWFSSFLCSTPYEENEKAFIEQLDFLEAVGASRINVCELTFEQMVSEAALAGFQGTEVGGKFPTDPAVLNKALDLRGIKIASQWFSSFLCSTPYEENEKAFIQQLDFLEAVGASRINVCELTRCLFAEECSMFGDNKPIATDEEWDKLCDGLNKLGKIAADRGFKLCFHHHMATVVQTFEETKRLMDNTDPRYVYLCFDTGHFTFSGEDAVKAAKEFGPRIGHVHLKDIRPDMMEKAYAEGFKFRKAVLEGCFTIPGDGCVDYPGVFKALHDAHYEGWFIVEAEQDPAKANPLEYAKMAREYIKKTAGI